MAQTIWTVIARSEIGSMIYPQDTASCTDKAEVAKWMEPVLDNGAAVMVLEISEHGIVDVTADMIEFAAAAFLKKHPETVNVEPWMQDTKAFADFQEEQEESEADGASYRRSPAAYYGAPSRL